MEHIELIVLGILFLLNLAGIALYHHTWKNDIPYRSWKCREFIIWTVFMFFTGVCYLVIRPISYLARLLKK